MEIIKIETKIQVYENRQALPEPIAQLLHEAEKSAKNAYAPYSHFKVGAAILLQNGEIVAGNNQENAVYPSGLCAERTTAYYASAHYPQIPFLKIAITAINTTQPLNTPVPPCGSCRQALLEYELLFNKPIEVIMAGETGVIYVAPSITSLLPCSFNSHFLS